MKTVAAAVIALLGGGALGYLAGGFSGKTAAPTAEHEISVREPPVTTYEVAALPRRQSVTKLEDLLLKADRNPWGALADLEKAVADSKWFLYSGHYAAMFTAWAQRDPEGAIRALHAVKRGEIHSAAGAVIDVLFEQDPERAAEVLKKWRHLNLLPRWLVEHPIEACRLVPEIAANQDGEDHFSFSAAWAKEDPPAALAWANSLTGWARTKAIGDVIRTWAKIDLDGAMRAYEANQTADWRTQSMFRQWIAGEWGKSEPAKAIEWMLPSNGSQGSSRGIRPIVQEWSQRDFDAALSWTLDQTDIERSQVALQAIAPRWIAADVVTIADYMVSDARNMQNDSYLIGSIGSAYLKQDVAAALDWVDQLRANVRSRTEIQMFTELIKEDRDTAVMEFTSRLKRFSVPTVKRFSKDYFEADPEAASSWLQTLPQGLARETAAEAMRQASDEE